MLNLINETENCTNCEKIHKFQIEYLKTIITEHHRYNTIVCTLGYGSMLTILKLYDINIFLKLLILGCLIISISFFVYLEMDNIVSLKKQIEKLTQAIYFDCNVNNIKTTYNEFYQEGKKQIEKFKKLRPISLYTGFIAAFLLFIGIFLPICNQCTLSLLKMI